MIHIRPEVHKALRRKKITEGVAMTIGALMLLRREQPGEIGLAILHTGAREGWKILNIEVPEVVKLYCLEHDLPYVALVDARLRLALGIENAQL